MATIDADLREHLGPDAVPQSIERNPLLMAVRNPVEITPANVEDYGGRYIETTHGDMKMTHYGPGSFYITLTPIVKGEKATRDLTWGPIGKNKAIEIMNRLISDKPLRGNPIQWTPGVGYEDVPARGNRIIGQATSHVVKRPFGRSYYYWSWKGQTAPRGPVGAAGFLTGDEMIDMQTGEVFVRENPLLMAVSNPGPVEVTFVDQTGTRTVRARVGGDVTVRSILPAIITRMGLPTTSPDGQAMSYSLDYKEGGVRLLEDQTLADAGVVTGHHLIVFPEIVAGNPVHVCCNPRTGVCDNPRHRNPLDAREKSDVISRAASAYSRSAVAPRRIDAEYYRGYGRGMMDVADRHSAAETYYPVAANPKRAGGVTVLPYRWIASLEEAGIRVPSYGVSGHMAAFKRPVPLAHVKTMLEEYAQKKLKGLPRVADFLTRQERKAVIRGMIDRALRDAETGQFHEIERASGGSNPGEDALFDNPYYVAHREAMPAETDIVRSLRRRRDTFQRFERAPGPRYGGAVGPFRTGDEAIDSWGWAAPMARGDEEREMRVAANPTLAAAPFHPGKKISVGEFESWLSANGNPEEKREYERSKAAYKKFHLGAEPKSITREVMDVGLNHGVVTDRGFGYGLGQSTHETYFAPKNSKKAGTVYVHKWGTRPEAIATSDGRVIMKPLKGTARIDDWLRG